MKLVICVAVVFISSVFGHEWLARRDAEPDTTCRNIYTQINVIMGPPNFSSLIRDGELNLDCSEQTLAKADECQNSLVMCRSFFSTTQLNTALNVFCSHRSDIEAEPACWTSKNLVPAIRSCRRDDGNDFALCAGQTVANLTECSATTGAIFRQLIGALFD